MSITIDVETVTTTKFKGAELHADSLSSKASVSRSTQGNALFEHFSPCWNADGLRELSTFAAQVADALEGKRNHDFQGSVIETPDTALSYAKTIEVKPIGSRKDTLDVTVTYKAEVFEGAYFSLDTISARELRDKLTEFLGE